jgi:hypothetical protein
MFTFIESSVSNEFVRSTWTMMNTPNCSNS